MLKLNDIMEVCLMAGKVMLSFGGETYRVEDTMTRIAKSFPISGTNSYVTPTGIFLTLQGTDEEELTKFVRIYERSIDLNKVTLVNEISRQIASSQLTLEEAKAKLAEIEKGKQLYPTWIQVVSSAIASGFFALMFNGNWNDYLPSFIAGGLGFLLFIISHSIIQVRFFTEMLASLSIGAVAYFIYFYLGFGENLDKIIIGAVMPLVPGVLITNAIRDLMAGDLLSGLARGAEAFLTALAIGTGIAVILAIF